MIEIKLVPTNVFTRWPCDICGGYTEKDSILCEGQGTDAQGNPRFIRICPQCLQNGNIDELLQDYAYKQERWAKLTRALIGQLIVPSYSEWQTAEESSEEEKEIIYQQWLASK